MKGLNLQIAATIAAIILTACSGGNTPSSVATEASAAADEAEAAGKVDTAQAAADEAAANADAAMTAADAPSKAEADEAIALLLNLNQLLCAKVVKVNPLKVRPGVLEVTCIEYRGGTATKNYILDTNNGTAFPQ